MSLTKVSYSMIDGAYINVRDFGATGDGTTDDTAAIQAAINSVPASGGTVYFPLPSANYKVSSLQMKGGVTLLGASKNHPCLAGDGTDSVIKTGVYPAGDLNSNRNIQYRDIRITNTGHPCIEQYTAVNFVIENCTISTTVTTAVDVKFSFRGRIVGNIISTGSVTDPTVCALRCVDNCNGLVIDANTITGGSGGSCINVEQSQQVAITNNIMEVGGGFGVSIASESVTGAGNCNGVVVVGNYFEQIKDPLKFGLINSAFGVDCSSNFINNDGIATAGDYCINTARFVGSSIENNACIGKGTEAFLGFSFRTSAQEQFMTDCTVKNNRLSGFASNYVIDPSMLNLAFMEQVFGRSVIEFSPNVRDTPLKFATSREFVSNVSYGTAAIIPATTEGGQIQYIDLFAVGTIDARLRVGSTTSVGEIVDIADLSTVSLTNGYARIFSGNGRIRRGQPCVTTVTAGSGTGTFYVVIGYKNQAE